MPDGALYDGEWRENIQNGYGIFRWADGSIYEGSWRDGKRHGTSGILIASDGFRYEGAWVNNAMEGRGVATYPKGQIYDGTWVAGKREGRGTIRFTNGAVCKWSIAFRNVVFMLQLWANVNFLLCRVSLQMRVDSRMISWKDRAQ